jgi:hypothetical protein
MRDSLLRSFFGITARGDDLTKGAIGGAVLQSALGPVRIDRAAIVLDLFDHARAVFDLDANMMDTGTGARELGFLLILAVVEHEGEIDVPSVMWRERWPRAWVLLVS